MAIIMKYGQERDLICTEEEREIFNLVLQFLIDSDVDVSPLQFVRVSDNYVTAKYGDWDLVRCKYTNRAKWILFPTLEAQKDKHPIESPGDVLDFSELIIKSVDHIKKYS